MDFLKQNYLFYCLQLLSDFHFVAPADKIAKLLVEQNIPTYLYVLNTTIEALQLPFWRRVPHDMEHLWLTGAPFMDVGTYLHWLITTYFLNVLKLFFYFYFLTFFFV